MKLIQELQLIAESKDQIEDRDEWMAAVKKAYPDRADKIKFKGRVEDGKHLFFAEIPGEDRCYGVYSMDDEKGEVLGEGFFGKKKPVAEGAMKDLMIDMIERAAELVDGDEEDPKTMEKIAKKVKELDKYGMFGSDAEILGMVKSTLG